MTMPLALRRPRRLPLAGAAGRAGAGRLAVLVVDDEEGVRAELAELLDRRNLAVLTAASAEAALAILRGRPDIGAIVTDMRMSGMDGLTLAERALARRTGPEALEVVLVTGYVTPRLGLAASRLGTFGLLRKPVRGTDLAALVAEALERAAARRAAARAAEPLPAPLRTRSPARAAEALLHTLAQRLAGRGTALERTARNLRAPLADLLGADARRLLSLIDALLDVAALEEGRARPDRAPVSARGLLGAIAAGLGALGIPCGRRITAQPDADPAFALDTPRLVRAVVLLAERTLHGRPGEARAELSVDAGAGPARIDLALRPAWPGPDTDEPAPEALLPLSVARRTIEAQGGHLDAWTPPGGGLRIRILLHRA
jgi:FixJ family two-component response regulator